MVPPFSARWEVTSHLQNHGSFVEVARVRPLAALDAPGELWVERLLPTLTPDKKARVLRRWYLASRLTSTRWPQLVDIGEESGQHWAVVEAPGQRPEATFPNPHVEQGLREVRALALAMAEAEAVLGEALVRAALAVRPSVLARSPAGRLMLQLAALDPEPDEGFATPSEWRLFTPEELLGHPATQRSNVFSLGWLLCLVLTGRGPYETGAATGDGVSAQTSREALLPLILGGRIRSLGFPDVVKGAEIIVRRALAPVPGARYASSAAFAEAMGELVPLSAEPRPSGRTVKVPAPQWSVADEQLPAALEATLLRRMEAPEEWLSLADRLDDAHGRHSERAALIRAHRRLDSPSASAAEKKATREALDSLLKTPGMTPELEGERLGLGWQLGYVRMLAVRPAGELPLAAEAHIAAVMRLLQHPSMRFLQLLSLNGPRAHAHRWVQALQRQPPPALKRVHLASVPQTDAYAIDLAYRVPRWTWTWGKAKRKSLWTRLFSLGSD